MFRKSDAINVITMKTAKMVAPVLLTILFGAPLAQAHRVNVFAWVEGSTVYTESKFPGGSAVHQGDIVVLNSAGDQVLSGSTDDQGQFSFDLGPIQSTIGNGPLKIVLNAGMGHRNAWTLTAEDLGRTAQDGPPPDAPTATPAPAPAETTEEKVESVSPDNPCLNRAEIEQIVEAAVDRKISPVMKMLVTIQEQLAVGVDDVFAGLGYILGLTGIAAYFSVRRKERYRRKE